MTILLQSAEQIAARKAAEAAHLQTVIRANTAEWHAISEPANYRANTFSVPQTKSFKLLVEDIKAKDGRVLLIGRGKSLAETSSSLGRLLRYFVCIVADTAVKTVREALPDTTEHVYVVSTDSDPKGHLEKYYADFGSEIFPVNWRLICLPTSSPKVIAHFKDRLFFQIAGRADVPIIRQGYRDYNYLPKVAAGSSCLTAALPIVAGLGAKVVAALGIDLLLTGDELERAQEDVLQKKNIVRLVTNKKPGDTLEDGPSLWTLQMFLQQYNEFREMLAVFNRVGGVQPFDLGHGIFPAPKVAVAELIRRLKHGELQHRRGPATIPGLRFATEPQPA